MQEVRFIYQESSLNKLFTLETEKLNKINDYMPNNNKPTKVELIEWFEVGTFASQAPAFGSSGGSSGGVHGWGGLPAYDVVLNPNNST